MKQQYLPETINLHFLSACQMRCKHCFAGFKECGKPLKGLALAELKSLILEIAKAPFDSETTQNRRLNLVGGEPTLHPHFIELVHYAHSCGLRVSLVTNGCSFINKGIPKELAILELVGVSIDSLKSHVNLKIGRHVRGKTIGESQWLRMFDELRSLGVDLKINTTVTQHNCDEDFSEFIRLADPIRWKIFQAMVVQGQNCQNAVEWAVSREKYDGFIRRHSDLGIRVCPEPEDLMRGSYAMISPDGRFYDTYNGDQQYSEPILAIGIDTAWLQVNYNHDLFTERTRNY